jgi:hypothetical protein
MLFCANLAEILTVFSLTLPESRFPQTKRCFALAKFSLDRRKPVRGWRKLAGRWQERPWRWQKPSGSCVESEIPESNPHFPAPNQIRAGDF